jgi:hypothetical protein
VLGRRTCRRGRMARTDGGGRGGSAPAMARAGPEQQEARDGSIGSREGTRAVARPWKAGGRSSTAAARMARWRGNADGGGGKRGVFIGATRLRGDGSGR